MKLRKLAIFLFVALFSVSVYADTNKARSDRGYLGRDQWAVRSDGELEALGAYDITTTGDITGATVTTTGATTLASLSVTGDIDANGDIVGDGGGEISGMLTDVEIATDDTVTVAETGRINIVTTSSTKTLPAVTEGADFIFQAGGAVTITVDPASTLDTILVGTLVLDGGDKAVTSGVTGDTIRLIGTSTANTWYASCYPNACTDGGA